MQKSTVEEYLRKHPEMRKRRYIPQIVSELTDVEPEKVTEVKTAIRRLQELIPNDSKGAALERNWRAERGMESQAEIVMYSGHQGQAQMQLI